MSESIVRALKAEMTYAVMYGRFERADAIREQIALYEPAENATPAPHETATPAAKETATPRKAARAKAA